ncbi:hypothetical protein [Salibacterium aidingense]|uniref:hypothetical protein n=1 Tax=Salibacterium aidingense TaxID=384933 RepID=UPI00040953A5|nr:hypothetical protein [Salibacterium aidingense]
MVNVLKVITSIWFIILMFQILSAFGTTIAEIPEALFLFVMVLFAAVVVREFKKGIVRELEQDSSGH